MDRYALNLTVLRPEPDAADLWVAGTKACCDARKVAPLERFMVGHADAWLSGLRRGRRSCPRRCPDRVGRQARAGQGQPDGGDDRREYERYIADHDVLINTLHLDGYASIGCWPCTEPSSDGRAGRWAGRDSKECGLHL